MRAGFWTVFFLTIGLLLNGCGGADPTPKSQAEDTPQKKAGTETSNLPVDLGTRQTGDDWPAFLGPTGDSKSAEKGLVAPWPEKGPRIVWHKPLGIGYPMPAISRGRLFEFSRHG